MAETHKWNKATKTGWKKENGKWVQYKNGQKTGVNKSNLYIGSRLVNTFKRTKRNIAAVEDLPSKSKGGGAANAATRTTSKSNSKGSSKDQDDARKEAELTTYLKKKPKGGYSKSNTKDPGPGKTTSSDSEKAAWLKKTRNSPAAKAGFSDDHRWELQQKHRKWKADRKTKTKTKVSKPISKKEPLKIDKTKSKKDSTKNPYKPSISELPSYIPKKQKKKKKKMIGSRLAANFD
tara:strand:- start:16 stop:717 length:702 start_codon:yes stop_codon:yes gene_type:complete